MESMMDRATTNSAWSELAALLRRSRSSFPRFAVVLAIELAAFPLLLVAWRRSLNATFFAVSADDFHRTLYAWEALQGHLVPSDLWLPLQFWIEALALQVYPHILAVPALVNVIASTITLSCSMLLGRALGLNRVGVFLLVLLAATMPWFVWLSLSGLAEPLFYAAITAAYLGIAQWRGRGHTWGLWLAAIGLTGAGMLRYDGWGHGVIFSLAVVWCWWRAQPRPHSWLLAAVLPWAFPVAWVFYEYLKYGDPFYFSSVVRNYYLLIAPRLPLMTRLAWQPFDLWSVAGITVPIGLVGLWLMRRQSGVALMVLMALASFALLMWGTLTYTIAAHNTTRLVVMHAFLLALGSAFALQRLCGLGRAGALAVTVLVLTLVTSRVMVLPNYPNGLPADAMRVGQHLSELRTTGQLRTGERIMIEVLCWDYIILHVLSNDPDSVLYDRPPRLVITPGGEHTLDDVANPSVLALPPDELRAELERRCVQVVVAFTARAVMNLRQIARETLHVGRFYVFALGN